MILVANFSMGCGALGAPARGDRDLPASLFAGYSLINNGNSPTASPALITPDGDTQIDDPTVVDHNGIRTLYFTARTFDGASRIVRAPEIHRDLLDFGTAATALTASEAWESTAVSAPSVIAGPRQGLQMVFVANGMIGMASSADAITWTHGSQPILSADAAHGETAPLDNPSLTIDQTQQYWLAYESSGAIFLARALSIEGPWTRIGAGPVITASSINVTVGTLSAPATSLTDPTLIIQRTAAGRTLFVLSAAVHSAPRIATVVYGWASVDGEHFTRSERPLYVDRGASIRPGSFEPLNATTTLLWIARESNSGTVIGALISPPNQRVGTQLMR
jgi:hypothetical protein